MSASDLYEIDKFFMKRALDLAKKASDLGEIPVGAVVVLEKNIIAEAYNLRETTQDATTHAELLAIKNSCVSQKSWRLCGCTLYVTLEPCPMCAGAIINSRISRVVFGARDPKAGACGSVTNLFAMPFNHQPELCGEVLAMESAELLRDFFQKLRKKGEFS